MPSRYNDKSSRCIWIEDELYVKAYNLAKELGYRSFSEFVRDLIIEAVEIAKLVKIPSRKLAKQSTTSNILSKMLEKLKVYPDKH